MNEHINRQFDQDIETIRSRLMQMGGLVESQIRAAVAGLVDGDRAKMDDVIKGDARVNELELAIDVELGQIIVRRQPAASDLRLILSISKTVVDLERSGDEAAKIARMARDLHGQNGVIFHGAPIATLHHLSDTAVGMLRRSLDAFARLDAAAAARVCGEDAALDEEFRAILRQLVTFMMEDPRTISTALNIVWMAKSFERIGDHAKNIAEHVIYIVKGKVVRHIPLAELQKEALG